MAENQTYKSEIKQIKKAIVALSNRVVKLERKVQAASKVRKPSKENR